MKFKGNDQPNKIEAHPVGLTDLTFSNTFVSQGPDIVTPGVRKDTNINNRQKEPIERVFQFTTAAPDVVFTSSDPTFATIDATGKTDVVDKTPNGPSQVIQLFAEGENTLRVQDAFPRVTQNIPTIEFVDYLPNSIGFHATNQIDARIAGKTAAVSQDVYTTQDHANSNYVRNVDAFANVDLTAISPWNSHRAGESAGTAITPRHIIFANHFPINNNTTIRFITNDNEVIERTLVAQERVLTFGSFDSDFKIGILDSDLPSSIKPMKVIPKNVREYFYSQFGFLNNDGRIPIIMTDQEEKLIVADTIRFILNAYPTDANRLEFSEELVNGDSGSPMIFLINSEPVLLSTILGGFAGSGVSSIATEYDAINSVIANLDANASPVVTSGYTLTDADFSSFPRYIDFGETPPVSFDAAQDAGTATVSGETLLSDDIITLTGNPWKAIELGQTYEIKTGGKLKFELKGTDFGEITGIYLTKAAAFANNDAESLFFFLEGSTPLTANGTNILDFLGLNATDDTYRSYEIDLGQYTGKSYNKIVFIGDDDADASTNVSFKNVEIQNQAVVESITKTPDVIERLRDNFNGSLGYTFTPKKDVIVYDLSRYVEPTGGMTQSHQIGLFRDLTRELIATVTVTPDNISGDRASAYLDKPVQLVKGFRYFLSTLEFPGGDIWTEYDHDTNPIVNLDDFEGITGTFGASGSLEPTGIGSALEFTLSSFKYIVSDELIVEAVQELSPNGQLGNFSGAVGYDFTPNKDITVYEVSRLSDTETLATTHDVRFFLDSDTSQLAIKRIQNSSSYDADAGRHFEKLDQPLKLTAGTKYIMQCRELSGSDEWTEWVIPGGEPTFAPEIDLGIGRRGTTTNPNAEVGSRFYNGMSFKYTVD